MSEEKEMFSEYIQGEGVTSGRYVRTHARSSMREFVLVEDTVHADIRLHILGDTPMTLAGLFIGDVAAIKKCCDLFIKEHEKLRGEMK